MIFKLLEIIGSFIILIIEKSGYFGVFFLMLLESASLPFPSEIIMPFSGFLAGLGEFSFWALVIIGTLGNLAGSVASYILGFYGGRMVIERYGKYFFISRHELNKADEFFKKHGEITIFFTRMLPAIRTFISLPAGIAKMDFKKFVFYTIIGSLPWNFALTYLGLILGENWESLEAYFRKFEWAIAILILGFLGKLLLKKIKKPLR
ncbi:MAG: DedA family protein [Candidatus Nealsonbacteria bacterium]|nr:DedA family protein [Candidatus Nealsonbacteria bacterium]